MYHGSYMYYVCISGDLFCLPKIPGLNPHAGDERRLISPKISVNEEQI